MNKKIISSVLAAMIGFGTASQAFAIDLFPYDELIFDIEKEDEEEIVTVLESDYLKEVKTISGLGWMQMISENDFASKDLITEYDMYEAMMNMLKGTEADKNIYVSNDNVTFEKLADAFLNNLSLSVYTPSESSFYATASDIGLFKGMKGISAEKYVTREELAKVLYNSLFLPQYKLTINGGNTAVDEGKTVIENLEIEIMEGVITANEYIDFYSDIPLNEGYIAIDKFKVKVGNTNADNMLGKHVTAYISDIDEDPTLLYAYEEEKTSADVRFETDDYISSESNVIEYYNEEGQAKRVKVNPQARVLYNGRLYGQFLGTDISDLANLAGFIQTIETGDDGLADIVLITVYETYFVESIYKTEDDFVIKDALNDNVLQYAENADYCFIKNNELCSYNEIKADDVLYVSESLGINHKVYTVYISDTVITSEIITSSEEEITIKDGSVIEIGKNFRETPQLKSATLYLGYDGKLAHLKYSKAGDMQYGYVMSLKCDTEVSDAGKLLMKVYTLDDEAVLYESLEEIKFVDGRNVVSKGSTIEVKEEKKTAKEVYDIICEKGIYQLVQFSVNGDNKITKLVTAVDSTSTGYIYEDAFSRDYYGNVRFYNVHMGSRYKRTASIKYMQVPLDPQKKSDEKYYMVKDIPGDKNMENVEYYDSTLTGNMTDGFVVIYSNDSNATISSSCNAGVVTKNSLVYDEEDETTKFLITLTDRDGVQKEITVNSDNMENLNAKLRDKYAEVTADELKAGDVILYEVNDFSEMTAFSLEVRASDEVQELFEAVTSGDALNSYQNFSAIYRNYSEVVELENSGDSVVFATNNQQDKNPLWNRAFRIAKGKPVLIYDSNTKQVTVGKGQDILKGDLIYIHLYYDYISQTYIVIR